MEVDIEQPPVENIWPKVMGIILEVDAWMVSFLSTFGVDKRNGYLLLLLVLIAHMHSVSWRRNTSK